MSGNSGIARQWMEKAENDLLNADNNLRSISIPFDTVCFHCQQAAEKLLKAFLAANDIRPPFTHDLLALCELAGSIDSGIFELRSYLVLLMPYAVEIRYPDDGPTASETDAREARDAAQQVREWVGSRLSKGDNT